MIAAHAAEAVSRSRRRPSIASIDARLQSSLESLARERLERLDPKLSIAIVAIHNATGEVRAQVGARTTWPGIARAPST